MWHLCRCIWQRFHDTSNMLRFWCGKVLYNSCLKDQGDKNFTLCLRMDVMSSHFMGETATIYLLNTTIGIFISWWTAHLCVPKLVLMWWKGEKLITMSAIKSCLFRQQTLDWQSYTYCEHLTFYTIPLLTVNLWTSHNELKKNINKVLPYKIRKFVFTECKHNKLWKYLTS